MARKRIIGDDEQIVAGFKINPEVKKDIKKAQRRLRNAPEFMKKLAQQQFGKLSTAGTYNELVRNYERAKLVNSDSAFTKRGFKKWVGELHNASGLSRKEIEYMLSQLDASTMTFIQNSPLKYGSNPQLDYIVESAIELNDNMKTAFIEIEDVKGEMEELDNLVF